MTFVYDHHGRSCSVAWMRKRSGLPSQMPKNSPWTLPPPAYEFSAWWMRPHQCERFKAHPLNELIDRAQCKAVRIDKSVEGFLSFSLFSAYKSSLFGAGQDLSSEFLQSVRTGNACIQVGPVTN